MMPQARRIGVLGQHLDRQIIVTGGEIDRVQGRGQTQIDVRVAIIKPPPSGQQPANGKGGVGANGKGAAVPFALDPRRGGGQMIQGRGDLRQVIPALGGQFHPLVVAVEQPCAQKILQALNLPADGA